MLFFCARTSYICGSLGKEVQLVKPNEDRLLNYCHVLGILMKQYDYYDHFLAVILQFEASSLTDSLPSVTDDGGLQDIENFGIFKGLNGMLF